MLLSKYTAFATRGEIFRNGTIILKSNEMLNRICGRREVEMILASVQQASRRNIEALPLAKIGRSWIDGRLSNAVQNVIANKSST